MNRQQPLDFSSLLDVDESYGTDSEEKYFLQSMTAREAAFKAIFGATDPPNSILSPNDPQLLLNWPGGGILRFPPREERDSWLFVTHGLSQPSRVYGTDLDYINEEIRSGIGFELVMTARAECVWPADVLLNVVRYLLFSMSAHAILPGHRIPCNGPTIAGGTTKLTHLLARVNDTYRNHIWLPAGNCKLLHLVGITTEELQSVKDKFSGLTGSYVLNNLLDECQIGFDTLPERDSLTALPDFEQLLERSSHI